MRRIQICCSGEEKSGEAEVESPSSEEKPSEEAPEKKKGEKESRTDEHSMGAEAEKGATEQEPAECDASRPGKERLSPPEPSAAPPAPPPAAENRPEEGREEPPESERSSAEPRDEAPSQVSWEVQLQHVRRPRATCGMAFHPGKSFLAMTCIQFQIILPLTLICHQKDKLFLKGDWYLLN